MAEWQTRYVQGVVSKRACEFNSHPRHQITDALVAQFGLERSPAEAEVVGSSPTKRVLNGRLAQLVRASALHAGGQWFKSSTAQFTLIELLYPEVEKKFTKISFSNASNLEVNKSSPSWKIFLITFPWHDLIVTVKNTKLVSLWYICGV